ncbi:MAG: hypothetical protein JO345_21385 [Streptosporangiaceae bacterium]|nr:hypothetical protein [Streptosporangiaceae bacterium]
MPTKITYYALINDFSSRERPGGVLRRIEHNGGQHDEAFTRNLEWERTPLLYSYERGDGDNDFYEISEEEAELIVERIKRSVTGAE